MRFDDRLSTIQAALSKDGMARERAWAQLVDILAQNIRLSPDVQKQAYRAARVTRPFVPEAVRRCSALALSSQSLSLDMFLLMAEDQLSVAAPILMKAQLSDTDWAAALPRLAVPARALVRERRDLSPAVLRQLGSFGPSDFALPPASDGKASDAMGRGFQDLLARIERRMKAGAPLRRADQVGPIRAFRFVTDANGIVRSVSGGAAAALVGLDLAGASARADPTSPLMQAFQKKTAFRAVAFLLPKSGPIGGAWRMSAVPSFADGDGQFLGYRGIAKRPLSHQDKGVCGPETTVSAALPDGLRQFIHELRTPLNAVRGFADLLVNQIFGPVSQIYQGLAREIIDATQAIVDILDDLPFFVPGHCEIGFGAQFAPLDATDLVARAFGQAQGLAVQRQVHLAVQIEGDLPQLRVDAGLMRRLLDRLVHLVMVLASPFDDLQARLARRGPGLVLTIRRPQSLRDMTDAQLFDPEPRAPFDPNGAPFGRGFGFRLIWAVARALGGQFETSRRSLGVHIGG